jgi:hypothetical protein
MGTSNIADKLCIAMDIYLDIYPTGHTRYNVTSRCSLATIGAVEKQ